MNQIKKYYYKECDFVVIPITKQWPHRPVKINKIKLKESPSKSSFCLDFCRTRSKSFS